jgi:hypothetical protein
MIRHRCEDRHLHAVDISSEPIPIVAGNYTSRSINGRIRGFVVFVPRACVPKQLHRAHGIKSAITDCICRVYGGRMGQMKRGQVIGRRAHRSCCRACIRRLSRLATRSVRGLRSVVRSHGCLLSVVLSRIFDKAQSSFFYWRGHRMRCLVFAAGFGRGYGERVP